MRNTLNLAITAAMLGMTGLAGCRTEQANNSAPPPSGGRDTVLAAERRRDEAARTADRTEDKIEGAFGELKKDTKEAVAVVKVKNAFIADDKIDAKNINVDGKDMTIHLYGTVASADEKKLAEQLAKKTAGQEFKLMSHLQVGKAKKGSY